MISLEAAGVAFGLWRLPVREKFCNFVLSFL